MSYLEKFKTFINSPKVFTVKFYEEYEGKGGYWDYRDNWVHGPYEQKLYAEKSFLNIESALEFADKTQLEILEIEQKRCDKCFGKGNDFKLEWYSKYDFNTEKLIKASVNWGGSNFKMSITYKFIDK